MDLASFEDGARIGRPPQNRITLGKPREDAATVGVEQPAGRKIAAGGEQSVRIVERFLDRRKRIGRTRAQDRNADHVARENGECDISSSR